MYRTGDQARWRFGWGAGVFGARGCAGEAARVPDRAGEIEAVLLRDAGVAQAVVVARADGRAASG